MARAEASILHVDLDAFYASVEQLADPSLGGRPVVVGGLGNRGVVAAASYEARVYGIHSAMPMARARRACPHAAFIAPRFEAYSSASTQVLAILASYTPLVEPIGFDEAFLDVAGGRRTHGSGPATGAAIRAQVQEETGLVASVGCATTKLLAKLASGLAKPDGLLVVEPGAELSFLHPLSVRRLWGVGPATRRRLDRLGVHTVGDLAAIPEAALVAALGDAHGRHLHALAHNDDQRPVEPQRSVKSIGHEETFAQDLTDREELARELVRMSERVAIRLRMSAKAARTVQLKVRFGDFRTITRSHTGPEPTDLARDIQDQARSLLDGVDCGPGVRLLGVSALQLVDGGAIQESLPFGGDRKPNQRALEEAVDVVRARFGDDAVGPATLVDRDGMRIGRRGTAWGPNPDADPDRSRPRNG